MNQDSIISMHAPYARPFDDQRYVRIRLESEAIKLILENVRNQKLKLAVSPVHHIEIGAIPDLVERIEILGLLDNFGELVKVDMAEARPKAERLFDNGFDESCQIYG